MRPTYDFEKLITLGDSNAMQNCYFAEYFKIQGVVREQWVCEKVEGAMEHFSKGLILSTTAAHCDYHKPLFVFDLMLCRMHVEELKPVRAKLVFEFFNKKTMELSATGWQIVVFQDATRKTRRMPPEFDNAVKAILWDY
jgi:acyl-CoA thioesterase FadM